MHNNSYVVQFSFNEKEVLLAHKILTNNSLKERFKFLGYDVEVRKLSSSTNINIKFSQEFEIQFKFHDYNGIPLYGLLQHITNLNKLRSMLTETNEIRLAYLIKNVTQVYKHLSEVVGIVVPSEMVDELLEFINDKTQHRYYVATKKIGSVGIILNKESNGVFLTITTPNGLINCFLKNNHLIDILTAM